jgi:hypothetical protein
MTKTPKRLGETPAATTHRDREWNDGESTLILKAMPFDESPLPNRDQHGRGLPGTLVELLGMPDDVGYWVEWQDSALRDAVDAFVYKLNTSPDEVRVHAQDPALAHLGPLRDIYELTVTIASVGGPALLGAVVNDAWKTARDKLRERREEREAQPPLLEHEYADHMARWFVGVRYDIGDWQLPLDELLDCISEEQVDDRTWTFVYERSAGEYLFRYTITVSRPDEFPHAIKARSKWERFDRPGLDRTVLPGRGR